VGAADPGIGGDERTVQALGEGQVQGVVEAEDLAQLPGTRRQRPMVGMAVVDSALSEQPARRAQRSVSGQTTGHE